MEGLSAGELTCCKVARSLHVAPNKGTGLNELNTRDRELIVRIFTSYYERMFTEQQHLQRRMIELMAMSDPDLDIDETDMPDELFPGMGEVVQLYPALAEAAAAIVLEEMDYKEALIQGIDRGIDAMAWSQEMAGESPNAELVAQMRAMLHGLIESVFENFLPDDAVRDLIEVINTALLLSAELRLLPEEVFLEEASYCRFMRELRTREDYLAEGEAAVRMLQQDELPKEYLDAAIAVAKMQAEVFGEPFTEEDEEELRETLSDELAEDMQRMLAAQRTATEMVYTENARRFFGEG